MLNDSGQKRLQSPLEGSSGATPPLPLPKSSETFQRAPGPFPANAHRPGGQPSALTPARGRCAAHRDASPERSYLEPARPQLRDRRQTQPRKPLKHRSAYTPGDRISGACRRRHGDNFGKSCESRRAFRRTPARAIRSIMHVPSGARTSLQTKAGVACSLP